MTRMNVVCCAVFCALGAAANAEDLAPLVGADALAKIRAAAPARASATPQKARRILVLTESVRDLQLARKSPGMKFVPHVSAPHAALAVQALGEKTGAFETVITSDGKDISRENLAKFDAVVLANVYLEGKLFRVSRDLKGNEKDTFNARMTALLDFVASGKGLAGLHNAACTALGFPEYNRMIGATHHGHAWYAHQTVKLVVEDAAHPVNAPFIATKAGRPEFSDDIYQFTAPYSRKSVHVLLSVDADAAPASRSAERADGDYPVSWVKPHGKGRVFYTSLGHATETFQSGLFLQHLLAGIQFAAGDLPADTAGGEPKSADEDYAPMKGWTALFGDKADDANLNAWKMDAQQKASWRVVDGIIRYDGKSGTLRTKQSFRNYRLRVDWRLPRKADSGVFVRDNKQLNIWTWAMGSGEMWGFRQKFKPKDKQERNPYTPATNEDRAVGEWNSFWITVQDDKVTVELNGREVITRAPLTGTSAQSPIALQKHGDPVEFKSIYIKPLKD